ncbi:MAG TPA: DNA polymerase Y family protein [Xanthobacteraceae bacterium]|jgi:protein ImuB|nr:DNA polymerase Y family protein [Xanthobacteraceae bacterium]
MSTLSPSRRYLALWLRRIATDRIELGRSPEPDDESARIERALVIVDQVKNAQRIVALNDEAERLGLAVNMALADARAMYPTLDVAPADPESDRHLLERIADWCDRYTPLVGLDQTDGLALDITGCAHLFGGEVALCRDLVRRLVLKGITARLAIADTFGGAWAMARYGASSIVPPGDIKAALAPLPVAALRIAPDIVQALNQAGLKRVADLIERPRAPLAARFGQKLIARIDQALGANDEPIRPRLPLPSYVVEQRFGEPIVLTQDVLGTIEQLACKLCHLMEPHGEGARLLQVALFRTDGKVERIDMRTGQVLRDAIRIRRLFADKLAATDDHDELNFGFDIVRLSALVTERIELIQTGLDTADHSADLAHLIDRLGARFGLQRIIRQVPQDTYIPEFAIAALPAHAFKTTACVSGPSCEQQSPVPLRPIRLFERPEPIRAIAEVPDGPPVRFQWRHVMHEVAMAEGPERIAMEWWRNDRGQALTRDYFRVESRQGARVWLYREGLYGRETAQPSWFLHGLFA